MINRFLRYDKKMCQKLTIRGCTFALVKDVMLYRPVVRWAGFHGRGYECHYRHNCCYGVG